MDLLHTKEAKDQAEPMTNVSPASEEYSVAMVDTIFADTLSRGMQNAITSQQNAQMASSTSITNACARILQARASTPISAPIPESTTVSKKAAESAQAVHEKLTAVDNTNHFTANPAQESPAQAKSEAANFNGISNQVEPKNIKEALPKFNKKALVLSLGLLVAGLIASGLYLALHPNIT